MRKRVAVKPLSFILFYVVCLLTDFDFFLHVDFLAVLVVELIFEEGKFLAGNNLYSKAVLELPFTAKTYQALIQISSDVRVDM